MSFVLVGFLITILSLLIGLIIGYLIGAKKFEEKIEQIKNRFNKPPTDSGPVKPYTPKEKEILDNPEKQRMKELI